MDTYIVRIYRRAAARPQEAAGTVEHVETGERVGFTGERELLDRLLARGDGVRREASLPGSAWAEVGAADTVSPVAALPDAAVPGTGGEP